MTRSQRIALDMHYMRSARFFAAFTRNWTQQQALNEALHRAYPEWRLLAASFFPVDTPLRTFPDDGSMEAHYEELFKPGRRWEFVTGVRA